MERFFFDMLGPSGQREYDHRGLVLPDLMAAEIEAHDLLKQMMEAATAVAISTPSELKTTVTAEGVGS